MEAETICSLRGPRTRGSLSPPRTPRRARFTQLSKHASLVTGGTSPGHGADSAHRGNTGRSPHAFMVVTGRPPQQERCGPPNPFRKGTLREHRADHARPRAVTPLRSVPPVCASFVAAATRRCPRVPSRCSMVRRGSTVRVRQRASRKACKWPSLLPQVCTRNARPSVNPIPKTCPHRLRSRGVLA
jgi:hypothetical protein